MHVRIRSCLFLMLVTIVSGGNLNWYQMNTPYGPVTLDKDGWAKPVTDEREKPVLFEDLMHNSRMYTMVMTGDYKGYYFSGDTDKGAGVWRKWDDAAYLRWNDCNLISESYKFAGMPLAYLPNGYFYFRYPSAQNRVVCIERVYPNQPKPPSAKCQAQHVSGYWRYLFLTPGKTTLTLKHGTNKRYEESKSQEWSHSVSAKASTSFTIKGIVDISFEAGYEFRTSATQSYANEWSSNKEESWSVEFADSDKGKALWQFVMGVKDTCHHEEVVLLREYALTPKKDDPPCCLPGHTLDGASYGNCSSVKYLIESKHSRCRAGASRRTLFDWLY